jgi:hypothetical protein
MNSKHLNENVIHYEDFVDEQDLWQFEADMENGDYDQWVRAHPPYVLSIFGAVMLFRGRFLTEQDLVYFMKRRVDLNVSSNAYSSEFPSTTPLVYACEYRYYNTIQLLIKLGANVNQRDVNGISPLEALLMGHRSEDTSDCEILEPLVNLLLENKVDKMIRKEVFENFCQEYVKNSEALFQFFDSCEILEPFYQ